MSPEEIDSRRDGAYRRRMTSDLACVVVVVVVDG